MAREPKADEKKARVRYVDQKGQWKDKTPAATKKKQAKEWATLENSLTPAQRKKMGLKTAKKG